MGDGRWITMNGTHIWVEEGQNAMDAFIKQKGKEIKKKEDGKKTKEKENENKESSEETKNKDKKLKAMYNRYSKKEDYEDYAKSIKNIMDKIEKNPSDRKKIIMDESKKWYTFMTRDFAMKLRDLI